MNNPAAQTPDRENAGKIISKKNQLTFPACPLQWYSNPIDEV
jgi:hypothetical protein